MYVKGKIEMEILREHIQVIYNQFYFKIFQATTQNCEHFYLNNNSNYFLYSYTHITKL